jgi:hypothetical protein
MAIHSPTKTRYHKGYIESGERARTSADGDMADTPSARTTFAGAVIISSPTDFGKLTADETEKWAKVVKFAGIKSE